MEERRTEKCWASFAKVASMYGRREDALFFFPLLQSLRYGADVWWHWAAMFEMQSTEMNTEGLFAHLLYLETTVLA